MGHSLGLLTHLLDGVLYFQGGLIFIQGGLYFVSSFYDLGPLEPKEGSKIARYLGLFGFTAGIGQIIAGYTGGVAAYIRAGGPEVVGWSALGFRAASAYFLGWVIVNASLRWLNSPERNT